MSDKKLQLSNCALRNLRMSTRAITQFYDKAIHNSGLKSTQFTLLNSILTRPEGISIGDLAELAAMDQTTVTRSVETLKKSGYVDVLTDAQDTRKKKIVVTALGQSKLAIALPLWESAQKAVISQLGDETFDALLETLKQLRSVKGED